MTKKILLTLTISFTGTLYFSCRKNPNCDTCREINRIPLANAGRDTIIVLPLDSISLNGSSSTDPDGTIIEFLWSKISGPASFALADSSSSTTIVRKLTKGVYRFELKITDNGGLSAKDTLMIIVDTSKTKTELLTTGTWKYIGATINPAYDYYGDGNPVTNIFNIMKACEKDDFETYKANGTWEYNEGPTKCDPSYEQLFSLPWNFTANETKLFVGTVEHTIQELTATTLKLRYTFEDAGVIYTEEDTYEH